jgi:hypothetical protein
VSADGSVEKLRRDHLLDSFDWWKEELAIPAHVLHAVLRRGSRFEERLRFVPKWIGQTTGGNGRP